jgi:hypothetical protein
MDGAKMISSILAVMPGVSCYGQELLTDIGFRNVCLCIINHKSGKLAREVSKLNISGNLVRLLDSVKVNQFFLKLKGTDYSFPEDLKNTIGIARHMEISLVAEVLCRRSVI